MNLWLPRPRREIEQPFMVEPPTIALRARGYFEFFKTYPNGLREKVAECPEVPNLILNNGQNLVFTQNNAANTCYISTGTATPAVTDTQLTNPAATGNQIGGQLNTVDAGPPYQRRTTTTYRFNVGTLNGNYTEVGVGLAFNNLFSRALIVDGGGTPTSLAVASTEQLDVTYTLCDEVNTSDVTFSVNISGTPYTGFFRRFDTANAQNVIPSNFALTSATAYSGTLNAYTSGTVPTGNLGNATSVTGLSYTTGNYYRDHNVTWNTTQGNGSIKSVIFQTVNGSLKFGMQFDTAIVKTNLQSLTLVMRLPFARV